MRCTQDLGAHLRPAHAAAARRRCSTSTSTSTSARATRRRRRSGACGRNEERSERKPLRPVSPRSTARRQPPIAANVEHNNIHSATIMLHSAHTHSAHAHLHSTHTHSAHAHFYSAAPLILHTLILPTLIFILRRPHSDSAPNLFCGAAHSACALILRAPFHGNTIPIMLRSAFWQAHLFIPLKTRLHKDDWPLARTHEIKLRTSRRCL